MKLLFDVFPALVFFIVYKIWDIYAATLALIIISLLQLAYSLIRHRKIDLLQGIVCLLVLVFGTATILLKDSAFLQWKVSIANWLLGLAFLTSKIFSKTPLIQRLLSQAMELPDTLWKKLNTLWGIYFLSVGVINLIIAKLFSLNAWVNFKVFGIIGLTVIFVIVQSIYLHQQLKKNQK
jgi:intracellular septation protein